MNTETVTLYHNPQCSKSRQTLQLLHTAGITPNIVEYLKDPPDKTILKQLLDLLEIDAETLVRKNEPIYRELQISSRKLNTEQWLQLLCEHPKLIQRPIVIAGNRAVIARPPERALELLHELNND